MGKFDLALPQPVYHCWHWLWARFYFKFVLPKIEIAEIDGIRLDLTSFSLKVRNKILRGYEISKKRMCQEFLSATDSVLEIGGGIGFISLFCQKKIGILNCVIVEANPSTIEILKRNYDLNNITPTVFNIALSKTCGSILLNIAGDFWEHFVDVISAPIKESLRVPAMTFPELLKKTGSHFDALIVDVEGSERLIDFGKIPERVRKIIIELHPHVIGRKSISAIISELRRKSFQIAAEEENTIAFLRTN